MPWSSVEAYWELVVVPGLTDRGVADRSMPERPVEGIKTDFDAMVWIREQEEERIWQHELAELGVYDGEIE